MVIKGKKVAIVMGSVADEPVMKKASDVLKEFGVDYEKQILSAHRMPNKTREFAKSIKDNGIEVVIAGAGKSAHLPGVIASYTTVPVIGVPVNASDLGGLILSFPLYRCLQGYLLPVYLLMAQKMQHSLQFTYLL